jgi:CheY-like chemotaxis protein
VVRVLIVDDDDSIRGTVRDVLEDAGYTVSEAADGLSALDQMRSAREPMVVVLDLMMPELDGAGVLGTVAGDQRLSNQHSIVLVTASARTFTLAFANLLTSMHIPVLTKPFDVDTLLEQVARAARRLQGAQ